MSIPTFSTPAARARAAERRAHPRRSVSFAVNVRSIADRDGLPTFGRTLNLSRRGALVELDGPPPPSDQLLLLRLMLPGAAGLFDVRARLVRAGASSGDDGPTRVAVETFDDLPLD